MVDWGLVRSRPLFDLPIDKGSVEARFEGSNDKLELSWEKAWVPNLEENLRIVKDFSKHSVRGMGGFSKTAHLIGGGPSLEENLGDFKKWAELDTFTSAHSLKFLLGKGMKPKYVSVLDCKSAQVDFVDVGEESKDMVLLMDIVAHPKIFEKWKGRIFFFRSTKPGSSRVSDMLWKKTDFDCLVPSGGNVMTSLLSMAVDTFGVERVIFTGHDYANKGWKGVDYAGGENDFGKHPGVQDEFYIEGVDMNDKAAVAQAMLDRFQADKTWCADIQGLAVPSLCRMEDYKIWTDLFCTARPDVEFVNCTEGGILGAYHNGNIRAIRQERLSSVMN